MRQIVAALLAAALFGCADRGLDQGDTVLGPAREPVYKLAALPPDNALLRLSDLTGRTLAGRVSVDVYLRETQVVAGVRTVVETRVATATAQADADLAFFVPEIPADGDGSGVVDFDDFFRFADTYGLREGEEGFNPVFDMDGSGVVDFDDFFRFADNFGRRSSRAAGKPAAIAPPVSYEDAPCGRMCGEAFVNAWAVLNEFPALPQLAAKPLQASEPEYRFHVESLETPAAFAAFDVIITGTFPAPGEPPREIIATPAGPVTSITRTLFISPQDTTVAYGENAAARGLLTVLYDGVPSLVQAVALVPVSRDTLTNADATFRVSVRFSYEGLTAVQTITVLSPPPPPDTEAPVIALQFLGGNAQVRVTVSDNRASQLSVSITAAGRNIALRVPQEAGTPVDYSTGLAYDELSPWRTSPVSIQVSDGLNEAVLDTAVALQDVTPPAVTITDGGSITPDGRVSLSFTADEGQSGVARSSPLVLVIVRFPDASEASGTYSSLGRYGTAGVSGTVNSVFGSPNTSSPRNVQVFVRVADAVGNTGEASVSLRQNTYTTSSPATGVAALPAAAVAVPAEVAVAEPLRRQPMSRRACPVRASQSAVIRSAAPYQRIPQSRSQRLRLARHLLQSRGKASVAEARGKRSEPVPLSSGPSESEACGTCGLAPAMARVRTHSFRPRPTWSCSAHHKPTPKPFFNPQERGIQRPAVKRLIAGFSFLAKIWPISSPLTFFYK